MRVQINSLVIEPLSRQSGWVHGFSPRSFTAGDAEEKSLLLGRDDQESVSREHRNWYLRSLGIESEHPILLNQVHGNDVVCLTSMEEIRSDAPISDGDALVTNLKEVPVAVLTADCVPVLLYDDVTGVVGAVHAGRRGTQLRILQKTIACMQNEFGALPRNMLMGVGPAIGGCCYEVDTPCVEPFDVTFPRRDRFIRQTGQDRYHLDLPEANRLQAEEAGILPEHVFMSNECTACRTERWYSYRAEGTTGRMMAVAMLTR